MRKAIIFFVIVLITRAAYPQGSAPDTARLALLTKPFIEQPLTLYKRQLSVQAGYHYNIIYNQFNDEGEIRSLASTGYNTTENNWALRARYGIYNSLEIGVGLDYIHRDDYQNATAYQYGYNDGVIAEDFDKSVVENKKISTRGWSSVDFTGKYLIPLHSQYVELAVSLGASLYLIQSGSRVPDTSNIQNVFTEQVPEGYTIKDYTIIEYRKPMHNNTIHALVDSKIKYHDVCLYLSGSYTSGQNATPRTYWETGFSPGEQSFTLSKKSESYTYGTLLQCQALVAFQVKPIFVVTAGCSGNSYSGGYAENFLKTPDKPWYNFNALVGYQLQMTPHLNMHQSLAKTLKGRNTDNAYLLNTTVIININM